MESISPRGDAREAVGRSSKLTVRHAGCKPTWDSGDFRRRKVEESAEQVGDRKVIAAGAAARFDCRGAARGGGDVTSSRDFVDNGVLRKNGGHLSRASSTG